MKEESTQRREQVGLRTGKQEWRRRIMLAIGISRRQFSSRRQKRDPMVIVAINKDEDAPPYYR